MYEQYWGLREKPFRKTPDPRYLFLNDTYEEALERLLFAVEEMELALLTGEVGAGKTLLTRALVDRVGDSYEVGMILNPRLSPRQFLRTAASELGVAEPRFHANDLLEQIHERLLALDAEGRAALLIVDEAHLIPGKPTFEEIRLLTNFQLDDRNLIAIVLVGQPELRVRLRHRAYRALTQRIGASFDLVPLAPGDTTPTSRTGWRRRVDGRDLHRRKRSRGCTPPRAAIPRVLNQLATQSLLEGMARGLRVRWTRRWSKRPRPRGISTSPRARGEGSSMGRMADARKRARREEAPWSSRRRRSRRQRRLPRRKRPPRRRSRRDRRRRGRSRVPLGGRARLRTASDRIVLPASGLAEDVLRQFEAAQRGRGSAAGRSRAGRERAAAALAPGRIELPASGLAEDILGARAGAGARARRRAGAPTARRRSRRPCLGTHSLSFFAAPAQDQRAVAEATEHLVTFYLDREEYGIDVRQVQEIRRISDITVVPRAPEFIRGVINLRGRILPVLDLKRKLGLGEVEGTKTARIVVVRVRERLLGLLVDGASQVPKIPVSRIEPAPEEVFERGGDYIRGVAKLDDRLIILVDLERLLAHELKASQSPAQAEARSAATTDAVS